MKNFLFIIFFLPIFILQTKGLVADNTCNDFESIILETDLTSTNPLFVNEEYLELNILGLQLYVEEGEDFYRVARIDHNHPNINKTISNDDIIHEINGEKANYEKYKELYEKLGESGMIIDYAYSLDLKYLLMMGLIEEFENLEFKNDLEKNLWDIPNYLKKYDNLDFELNIKISKLDDVETEAVYENAQSSKISTNYTSLVPTVLTTLDLYNVNSIDGKTQSFNAGYVVEFSYYDRYNLVTLFEEKFGSESEYLYAWCEWTNHDDSDIWGEIEYLWKPDIDFINRLDYDKDKTLEKLSIYYYWAEENEPPVLQVLYETRGSALFSTEFEYGSFPFDRQYISVDIANHDGSGFGNHYTVNNLDFYPSLLQGGIHQYVYKDPRESYSNQQNVSGWRLGEKSIYKEPFMIWEGESIDESTITSVFGIQQLVERNTIYFVFKIFSPILLILMICWSVFWSPPKELESRLTVTITCFLALVAYTFVIDDDLPKLSYLTLMDQLILISYFFASLPTVFSIISHRLSLQEDNSSRTFDVNARLIGLIGYPLFCYVTIQISASNNLYNTTQILKALTFN